MTRWKHSNSFKTRLRVKLRRSAWTRNAPPVRMNRRAAGARSNGAGSVGDARVDSQVLGGSLLLLVQSHREPEEAPGGLPLFDHGEAHVDVKSAARARPVARGQRDAQQESGRHRWRLENASPLRSTAVSVGPARHGTRAMSSDRYRLRLAETCLPSSLPPFLPSSPPPLPARSVGL